MAEAQKIQKVSQIRREYVCITPDIARKYLEKNDRNRSVRRQFVRALSRAIAAGEYHYDGNPIKFDWNGSLVDGQHRLIAISEGDTPVYSEVLYGLDPDAIETIDSGISRSCADVLAVSGVVRTNTKMVATAARWVFNYGLGKMWQKGKYTMSNKKVLELVRETPELIEESKFITRLKKPYPLSSGVALFLYHEFRQFDEEGAEKFFLQLFNGENISAKDLVFHLRNILLKQLTARMGRMELSIKVMLTIRCWNLIQSGNKKRVRSEAGLLRDIDSLEYIKIGPDNEEKKKGWKEEG